MFWNVEEVVGKKEERRKKEKEKVMVCGGYLQTSTVK